MNLSSTEGSISTLLSKLCLHFAKNDVDLSTNLYKLVMHFLTSASSTNIASSTDEQFVVAQIRKHLLSTQSAETLEKFDVLYASFQKSTVLKHKCSILMFLLSMSSGTSQKQLINWNILQDLQNVPDRVLSVKSQLAVVPDDSSETVKKVYSGPIFKNSVSRAYSIRTQGSTAASICWGPSESDLRSTTCSRTTFPSSVTEADLLQDVIYSFQGVDGRFLRRETDGFGYVLEPKTLRAISPIQRNLVERLSDVGFLHNKLKYFCDNTDKPAGTVAQALCAVLRDELAEYYKIIAVLQAQLKKQSCMEHSELTLRRMLVWVCEPYNKFQWLAHIAEQCSNERGGALVSAVHNFLHHGARCAQEASAKVLAAVCRPIYLILLSWLLDGELEDSHAEFFIEVRSIYSVERLWHDKYHVRYAMIPSFISVEEAEKILATGKSINFLKQICKDGDNMICREALQKLFSNTTVEVLFDPERSMEFHSALETVYKEASLHVLLLLRENFRLMEHLQALRRYLLLGQGDFIRHLLELLAPELSKPTSELYGHTLTAILESAVRVTNAQYEDEETLERLNVALMKPSTGDTGWDVFSLVYIVDGPVGTIFQPTMSTYKCLFGALWKAKRMEFVLSNMRKQQISSAKLLRKVTELKPVMHVIHILASEMIHFLHQTQYYFLFEVLECSWAAMLGRVNQAGCLDDIIAAHATFLTSVKCGVLLDQSSVNLCGQLRILYNLILNLESIQEALYSAALREREALISYSQNIENSEGFGMTFKDEREGKERRIKFNHFLNSVKAQVKQLSKQYNDLIKKYLGLLATSSNMNLQLLSVRLNFNDYYKIT